MRRFKLTNATERAADAHPDSLTPGTTAVGC
jgi:hypothetical protein